MHISNGPSEGAASPLLSQVPSCWALSGWRRLFLNTGGVTEETPEQRGLILLAHWRLGFPQEYS